MKALGRVKPYIPKDLALMLYNSLILPHFDYGDVVYDAMSATSANQLQVIQNTCLRICLGRGKDSPTEALHTDSNIPRLSNRRKQHTGQFVYKGRVGASTMNINSMFKLVAEHHNRSTRSSNSSKLYVPSVNLKTCRGNIRHRGTVYYNTLDQNIMNSASYDIFKNSVKHHFK